MYNIKLKVKRFVIVMAFIALAETYSMVVYGITRGISEKPPGNDTGQAELQEYLVKTYVANRLAETSVESKCVNTLDQSTIVSFAVFIPESAFICNFYIEIDGVRHQSSVTKGTTYANVPNGTVYRYGSARSSQKVGIDLLVAPQSRVLFHLKYEQLIVKMGSRYELITNIIPGSFVPKLEVEVVINETGLLQLKRDPFLRCGVDFHLIPDVDLQAELDTDDTSAVFRFKPDISKQLELVCAGLRNQAFEGLSGQLVLQFDIKMENQGGLTLAEGNSFVSFFSPTELKAIPKHVVFILDVSGSMYGKQLAYLKEAMNHIMPRLLKDDLYNIVEFNGRVNFWKINRAGKVTRRTTIDESTLINDYGHLEQHMWDFDSPNFFRVTARNIESTKKAIAAMNANGQTNSMGALETGLYLVKCVQDEYADQYKPIIVFLTDGKPTIGILNEQEIVRKITIINQSGPKAPIYSIAFGNEVNWEFLRSLSLRNGARPVKIEIAEDTTEQLEIFFEEISEPYLTNVHFRNLPAAADITRSRYPIYFKGSELMIAGRGVSLDLQTISTSARCINGQKTFNSVFGKHGTGLERIWANLMISQLTEKFHATQISNFSNSACALATEQSLVTEFTSLIVGQTTLKAVEGMRKRNPKAAAYPSFCYNISAYVMERFPTTTAVPETTTTKVTTTTTTEAPETTTTAASETTTTEAPTTTTTASPETTTTTVTEVPDTTTTAASETTTTEAPTTTTTESPETTTTKVPTITVTEAPETTTTTVTEAPDTTTTTVTEAPETTTTAASETTTTEAPTTASPETTTTTVTEVPDTTTTAAYETTTTEALTTTTTESPETTTTTVTDGPETTTTAASETTTTEAPTTTEIESPAPTTTKVFTRTVTKAPETTTTDASEKTTIEKPETATTEEPTTITTEDTETTTTEVSTTCTTEVPKTRKVAAPETKIIPEIYKCYMRAKSCQGGTEKWFYSRLSGRCTKFNSCKDGTDIFDSEQACEDTCVRVEGVARCKLPISLGDCSNFTSKWFYVKSRNACMAFDYRGCYGNTNKFDTKQECTELCVR